MPGWRSTVSAPTWASWRRWPRHWPPATAAAHLARACPRAGRRPDPGGGFAKQGDIAALARAGVEAYVPVPRPRAPRRDRHAARADDPPGVAAWRARMASDAAKAIYKRRAATAECVNAQARNRGLTRFLVRGLTKVKAVATWYALAHNMACTWRLAAA